MKDRPMLDEVSVLLVYEVVLHHPDVAGCSDGLGAVTAEENTGESLMNPFRFPLVAPPRCG